MCDQFVAETATCTPHIKHPRDKVHVVSGIRTHDTSNQAAADPRLSPDSHRIQQPYFERNLWLHAFNFRKITNETVASYKGLLCQSLMTTKGHSLGTICKQEEVLFVFWQAAVFVANFCWSKGNFSTLPPPENDTFEETGSEESEQLISCSWTGTLERFIKFTIIYWKSKTRKVNE
jgi:hypothetical protein